MATQPPPDSTISAVAEQRLVRAYMQWAIRSKLATAANIEGDMAGAERMRHEAEAELQRVKDEVAMTTDQRDSEPTKNWAGGHGAPPQHPPPPRPRPPSKREQYAALATLLDQAASMAADLPGIERGGILTAQSQAIFMANAWATAERAAPMCPACGGGMEAVQYHPGMGTFEPGLGNRDRPQLYRCECPDHAGAPVILSGPAQRQEGIMSHGGQHGTQHTDRPGRHPEWGGGATARRPATHQTEPLAAAGRPDPLPHGGPDTTRSSG